VPLVLIGLGVVVLGSYYARGNTASLRALQIVMGLFVLSGFAGMLAHFNGSMEYQLELNPDMKHVGAVGEDPARQGAPSARPRDDDANGAARARLCVHGYPLQREGIT